MAHIRSRKHAQAAQPQIKTSLVGPSLVALGALSSPLSGYAQQANAPETLPEVKVQTTITTETPVYKVEKASSPKLTQPLLDTPQTITVIPKELMQERGATTLVDALRNTPGITMQLGENGATSAGDTFQMRGFSTESSIFVDGVRDLGAVTRDTFNFDQVEVVKGPAGTIVGRGATSGYINLVSKLPTLENATSGTATYNTADNKRLTLDVDRKIGDTAAVRLNVFGQDGGVPGRDVVNNSGWGIAPSVAWGLGTPTRVYLYAQHISQDNVPDGGVPTNGLPGFYKAPAAATSTTPATGVPQAAAITRSPAVDRSNYYGSVNDYEDVTADMVSFKVEHDFSDGTTLRNITRYGTTNMNRVLTGVNAMNNTSVPNLNDLSTWTVPRTRQGLDRDNEIITNQTNVTTTFVTGEFKHSFSGGLELTSERQKTDTFSSTGLTIPAGNLYHPNANDVLPLPYKTGGFNDGTTVSISPYAIDTMQLTKEWSINGGLRLDHYKTDVDVVTATQNTAGTVTALTPSSFSKSDDLWSWNLGAVYKPVQNGSVYAAAGTSQLPPGGNSFQLAAASTNSTNNVNLDPQVATNLEFGTKWDLLNKKLGVTAALYRTEITNEVALLDSVTNTYGAFGKRRVQGVELSAAGDLTAQWHISAGLQTLSTKMLSGAATGNNSAGAASRWSPDLTATAWTTYDLPAGWQVGGGVSYVSEQKRIVDPSVPASTQPVPVIPSYTTVDAMVSYAATKNLTLRLNVYNVFDKEYIATLNNSGARYTPGAPRYASLNASFLF